MCKKVIHKHKHFHFHNGLPTRIVKKQIRTRGWTLNSRNLHYTHLQRAIRILNMKLVSKPELRTGFKKWATDELESYLKRPYPARVKPNTAIMCIVYRVYFNSRHFDTFSKLFHISYGTLSHALKLMT